MGERVPPLVNGDRLSVEEFHRRYESMPHVKKAELVRGVVYIVAAERWAGLTAISVPVSFTGHGGPHFRLGGWLFPYVAATPAVDAGLNSTIVLPDQHSETQPDVCVFIASEHGGRVRATGDGYLLGAPDLVAEVAASRASYDYHDKMDVYREAGAAEYLVWRTDDNAVDWFSLRGGRYEPIAPGDDGLLRSGVFPGLWLDPAALLREDLRGVTAAAQAGIASPEHAAFVARLRAAGPA